MCIRDRARTSPALMPKNQCNWNRVFFNTSLALFVQVDSSRRALCRGVVEKHSFLRTKAPFIWMNGAGSDFAFTLSCGSELARDSGVSANINVECGAVIASKLAPTGIAV